MVARWLGEDRDRDRRWWPAGWARIAIAIAAVLMAVAGFRPRACCCCKKEEKLVEGPSPSES
jgi:hypothetical protein